jgi:hypothetical protein
LCAMGSSTRVERRHGMEAVEAPGTGHALRAFRFERLPQGSGPASRGTDWPRPGQCTCRSDVRSAPRRVIPPGIKGLQK